MNNTLLNTVKELFKKTEKLSDNLYDQLLKMNAYISSQMLDMLTNDARDLYNLIVSLEEQLEDYFINIEEKQQEFIISAAIKQNNLIISIPQPGRHSDIINNFFQHNQQKLQNSVQGFLTSKGRFLTREEAKELILKQNPVKKFISNTLTTEDLW